ncbi:MAG: hypothetical protein QXR84_07360, partial [Candidatus Bathyarchaeia archaeon]
VLLHIAEHEEELSPDDSGCAELRWNPELEGPVQLTWWAEAIEGKRSFMTPRRRLTCIPFMPPPPEIMEIEERIERVGEFLRRLRSEEI